MKTKASFGSISTGTLLPDDLIPTFADELRRLRGALPRAIQRDIRGLVGMDEHDKSSAESEILEALQYALDEYAPAYGYFGAHSGDGADFGFWLHDDWQELAREDGVLFLSDLSEVPPTHCGRSYVCVVNDHGNATLYRLTRKGEAREVWGVV
jgi:hypothetical protein